MQPLGRDMKLRVSKNNSSVCLILPVLLALLLLPAAEAQSLSAGQSPMSNFKAHAENKCPNEWKDYQSDKRTPAAPIATDPAGLPSGAPEGKSNLPFDGGIGMQTNPVGELCRTKCAPDQAGVCQQTALSVPQTGPRPVTSSAGGVTMTNYTQPFLRPALMSSSEAQRTTMDDRFKRSAEPLGSTMAAAAPASNAAYSGNPLWANLPCTANGASAVMMSAFGDQFLSASTNPAANAIKAKADQEIRSMQNADNQGNCARQNCETAFESMVKPLINVANEDAASQCDADAAHKTESNVIWMVQQLYKKCYLQMAILLLLPGAVLTQVKFIVSSGLLSVQDDDASSPFVGITRSLVAIFLIPATQLVMSYCIDIGNALTDPVAQQIKAEMQTMMHWVNEQAYASNPTNQDNCIRNVQGRECQGKLMGTPSSAVVQERQSDLTVMVQNTLNTINAMLSQGLNILNAFQLVLMCYLFLLGPVAAALYAWPASVAGTAAGDTGLFNKVFASWLDGVIILCLWKFFWCIILLCMAVRLTQGVDANSQYEMYYYTAFMGILTMVPFHPFDFRPGDVIAQVLQQAQGGGCSGGGGGGAGGGCGGGGGGRAISGSSQSRGGGMQGTGGSGTQSNSGHGNSGTQSSQSIGSSVESESLSNLSSNSGSNGQRSSGSQSTPQPASDPVSGGIRVPNVSPPPMLGTHV